MARLAIESHFARNGCRRSILAVRGITGAGEANSHPEARFRRLLTNRARPEATLPPGPTAPYTLLFRGRGLDPPKKDEVTLDRRIGQQRPDFVRAKAVRTIAKPS